MEQISYDDGSGGYHRPSARAAALTSTFRAPGWTTATIASASMRTSPIRSVDSVMQPSTAADPPESPVQAPRVTTPPPTPLATRRVAATSAVDAAPNGRAHI